MTEKKKYYLHQTTKEKFEINTQESVDKSKNIYKWGKKNDAPQEIVELLEGSAVHRGIIESKVSFIISDGWEVISNNGNVDIFLKNGISDYDLTDVAEASTLDLETFGAFAVKLVFTTVGDYSYCEHLDMDLLRRSSDSDEWILCDDWSDYKAEKKHYTIYSSSKDKGVYILVFKLPHKRKKKELGIYPKPSYIAALTDIESSKDISHFRLASVKNNFSLGTIINNPNGVPETEEEKKAARKWAEKFQLDGEYEGGFVINYSDGKENEITVNQLNGNDLDKRYLQTETSIVNNILTGHSITSPMLVGIKTSGQLGGSEEIETSFEIFKQTYISKRQNFINRAFNYIMNEVAEIQGEIALTEAKLPFEKAVTEDVVVRTKKVTNKHNSNVGIIEHFKKAGKPLDELNIVFKEQLDNEFGMEEAHTFSSEKVKTIFEEIGQLNATERRLSILSLLEKGNRVLDISKVLDMPIDEVHNEISTLKKQGLVNDSLEVTSKGNQAIRVAEIPVDEFEVRYTYEKRDDIPGSTLIKTSRDFCREMIGLNRAYTREEIDMISNIEGRDVFKDRGGWYHNPQTDRNTPYCRHIWKFILVRK